MEERLTFSPHVRSHHRRYGKPLKKDIIIHMMKEADEDNDGEISLVEFKMLMQACEEDTKAASKQEKKGQGIWSVMRERGLVRSREQKASDDMRLRRITAFTKRVAELEKSLMEAIARDPKALPPSVPLPPGGGLPPKRQVQEPPRLWLQRTYDIRETLRRIRSPTSGRRSQRRDIESGVALDFGSADGTEPNCLISWWRSLPSPGEAVLMAFDFLDSYAPLIALLALPTSWMIKTVRKQIDLWMTEPGVVAPPPPPAHPDVMKHAQESFFKLAQDKPGLYLALDLGLAFALGALAFFWKDISDWFEAQRMKGQYQKLSDDDDADDDKPVLNAQALKMELYKTVNMIEELEIKLKVHQRSKELERQLKEQRAHRAEVEQVLEATGSADDQQASDKPKAVSAKSEFSVMMNNMANGLVEVSVYFADIISDIQVLKLLYDTGNITSAFLSFTFLVAQFFVIYIRVLPYLQTTFGETSAVYQVYLWTGFPIGSLGLDVLMFLEPFGLLAVLPLPTWLKTFVPAYKATRVICEVFIESLPQTLVSTSRGARALLRPHVPSMSSRSSFPPCLRPAPPIPPPIPSFASTAAILHPHQCDGPGARRHGPPIGHRHASVRLGAATVHHDLDALNAQDVGGAGR